MLTFLLWRRTKHVEAGCAPPVVAARLHKLFDPLFGEQTQSRVVQNAEVSLVTLELPVRGWKPPLFEADEKGWALALAYPINGRAVLAERNGEVAENAFLPPSIAPLPLF